MKNLGKNQFEYIQMHRNSCIGELHFSTNILFCCVTFKEYVVSIFFTKTMIMRFFVVCLALRMIHEYAATITKTIFVCLLLSQSLSARNWGGDKTSIENSFYKGSLCLSCFFNNDYLESGPFCLGRYLLLSLIVC